MGNPRFNDDGRLRGTYCYVLMCADLELIYAKIGYSRDPLRRLQDLIDGCPVTPHLFATVEAYGPEVAQALEAELLKATKQWHHRGEWRFLRLTDQAAFKTAMSEVLERRSRPHRKLEWTVLDVQEFEQERRESRAARWSITRKFGLSYQDAMSKGLTRAG